MSASTFSDNTSCSLSLSVLLVEYSNQPRISTWQAWIADFRNSSFFHYDTIEHFPAILRLTSWTMLWSWEILFLHRILVVPLWRILLLCSYYSLGSEQVFCGVERYLTTSFHMSINSTGKEQRDMPRQKNLPAFHCVKKNCCRYCFTQSKKTSRYIARYHNYETIASKLVLSRCGGAAHSILPCFSRLVS